MATRIGSALPERGVDVTTRRVPEAGDVDGDGYDGVVVGASATDGAHRPEVIAFVERHVETLRERPSALFQPSPSTVRRGWSASPSPAAV